MKDRSDLLKIIGGIIGLITAVIMLIVAYKTIPSNKTEKRDTATVTDDMIEPLKNSKKNLNNQKKEMETLEKTAYSTSLSLKIINPENGAEVTSPKITVKGTIEGRMPGGYRFYVLLKDKTNYFLQYPAVEISGAQNEWSHNHVRFGSNGEWEIAICLADKAATSYFEKLARENNRSGFPNLPGGTKIIKQIDVTKK